MNLDFSKCPFCELRLKQYILLQTDEWICIVDHNPVSPGHMIIFPRRHIRDLGGLKQNEWIGLRKMIDEVIDKVQKVDLKSLYNPLIEATEDDKIKWFCKQALKHPRINTKPDAHNDGVNNGRAAGRTLDGI